MLYLEDRFNYLNKRNKNYMKRTFWWIMTITLLLLVNNNAVAQFFIKGSVYDAESRSPLQQATVVLKNADSGKEIQKTSSNSDGQFQFTVRSLSGFIVEASMNGYSNNSSQKFYFGEFQEVYTVDKIYLKKIGSTVNIPPPDTLPPQKVIEKKFDALQILPTQGAYELFYALNPELKNGKPIPENYQIKHPNFPDFSPYRKSFNQQFKKDKRNGEPSGFFKSNPNEEGLAYNSKKKGTSAFSFNLVASVNELPTNFPAAEKLKKFVFVVWKDGPGGPITTGNDVEGKYLVKYYLGRMRGDTSSYYNAPDATYGYAPMGDNKYYIEVYEQSTMKKVRISDDQVDPHIYFERKDIWIMFNIVYTKIPIHVLPD